MNKKQIVVVIAVAAITGYLYLLPVKGIVKSKETHVNPGVAGADRPAANITVETVSATAKTAVGSGLSAKINDLEVQLKSAPESGKLALEKQLATQWDDDNQAAPAAFYYLEVAKAENKFTDWLNAGNHFNEAFKFTQDSTAQPVFLTNAAEAFKNALKLQPQSLDAKTGLGIAYVNGAAGPMDGIRLLLQVVKQDPKKQGRES